MRLSRTIKNALGRTLYGSGLHAALLRDTAIVVAFHRVNDTTAADGLTVPLRAFELYCRFFSRHFRVVPLSALVHRLERGLPVKGLLAITFDDGYRDNVEMAAPVLDRLSLPATFFVVSEWIGTELVPWWDRQRGVRHPWMTWNDVKSLHQRGFEIGGHTRTHVDLGATSPREARLEVVGARHRLEDILGAPVDLFAYPYGRRANLTEDNRKIVRDAGFRCCCSCFGGVVTRTTDPFRLPRVPLSPWYSSPHQFGFEVALGMSVLAD
jgi:peptidoglycan/xylan/chitin deacetylase (PgdA/CDA1 family)